MKRATGVATAQFGHITTVSELGAVIRMFRKNHQLTLEKVSGITNISMRFLSELERGKETAELGKAIAVINQLGLELIIQPRGSTLPSATDIKRDMKD